MPDAPPTPPARTSRPESRVVDRLVIGAGYLGLRAARRWRDSGDRVALVTRSQKRAETFAALGFDAIVADVVDGRSLKALPTATTMLHAVGYDRSAAPSKRAVYVDGLSHVLDAIADRVDRVVYASSTSVYGSEAERTVDAASAPNPTTEGGEICLAAEDVLRTAAMRHGFESIIVRYAGLYGPGRTLAKQQALRDALELAGTGDETLNLIQIEDAAAIAIAAADAAAPPPILLASDREPVCRRDYYRELAALIDAQPPRFNQQPRAGRPLSSRRCDSSATWEALAIEPAFPTYREGLHDAIAASAR